MLLGEESFEVESSDNGSKIMLHEQEAAVAVENDDGSGLTYYAV